MILVETLVILVLWLAFILVCRSRRLSQRVVGDPAAYESAQMSDGRYSLGVNDVSFFFTELIGYVQGVGQSK